MSILTNLDLFSVGTAIASIGILGFIVFLSDKKNITNRSFLFFSSITILWSTSNYLIYSFKSELLSLLVARIHIFFAVWYCFFLYRFFYVLPSTRKNFSKAYKFIILPSTIIISILNLSPFVLSNIVDFTPGVGVPIISPGPGILLFGVLVVFLIGSALIILIKKTLRASGKEKTQFRLILIGTTITFILHLIFNFVFPIILKNPSFVPFGAIFVFPLIAFTAYAILRHKLFNIKVAGAASLVFLLSVITLAEVIFAEGNITLLLFRSVVFLLVLLFGILLIKSVLREVTQREKIEGLMRELGHANDRLWVANEKLQELDKLKTEFVSMATHQLRSPLTAIKGYASMILENSFGPVEEKARGAVDVIFQSSQKLVNVIEDFLNISRIELGTMKYEKIEFDLRALAETTVKEQRPNIEKRGLQLSFEADQAKGYKLTGDSGKISQVINNLIDNAVKYTREGWIKVALDRLNGKVRLTVADSGVGIPAEVIPKLFQKFIRAEDAGKINIQGTGLGLYVAKQIVEAHGGKIWAESEGAGKGSKFIVEL